MKVESWILLAALILFMVIVIMYGKPNDNSVFDCNGSDGHYRCNEVR